MNNRFSENLKKIRKEYNLSQEQLADELGVSRQAISKWESAIAYPEMDKIIALCDKFDVNIDDLLHKDIKEVKLEEESKKKLNVFMSDFLKFITNTINLFSNMTFKSKIKCLFEQVIISLILLIISSVLFSLLNNLFNNILSFIPDNIYYFITNLLQSILMVSLLLISVVILSHIFKIRYLNYYEAVKKEIDDTDLKCKKVESNTGFKQNESKIIIRDPKHSEYKFINGLFKLVIGIIKFFALFLAVNIALIIIFLFGTFILSFLVYKTGLFFVGLLTAVLSLSSVSVIILLLILNFVFNRKNNKKNMIWSFIISIISLGIGSGLIFVGVLSFDVSHDNKYDFKIKTSEYEMQENLMINYYDDSLIEYVETDNKNIKVEYTVNKFCDVRDAVDKNGNIIFFSDCNNLLKLARENIKNINQNKVIFVDNILYKVTVYTTKSNIEKMQDNRNKYILKEEQQEEEIHSYKMQIEDLENENYELKEKLSDLEIELERK